MPDTTQNNACYWVGIGASAGGLEAIKRLVPTLPSNANMIYIVAQHLSPKHKSMMTELVQRDSALKVVTAQHDIEVEPNTIYITPPQRDVEVSGNRLKLIEATDDTIPKPSVNRLFLSLAEEKKDRAIGVILSGTGSDGAHGVKIIRAAGGSTIVQEPNNSLYDGMPLAAMKTNCVDLVLNVEQIGAHLTRLSQQLPHINRLRLEKAESRDHFSELIEIVRSQCGVSFKDYKKATLQRRIERRMIACGITDFEKYVEYVRGESEEVDLLFKDILISVTDFFRDSAQFEGLKGTLAKLVNDAEQSGSLRLWTVGCATGEEAYSLAILVAEALEERGKTKDINVQIFATDVDANALSVARRGIYDAPSMSNVPPAYIKKYFVKQKNSYEVVKQIKEWILFANHNVIEDPPFLRVDLITCRNLLIYFEAPLQKKVYHIFHYALKPKGCIFLGRSESISHVAQIFVPINSRYKLFQRRAVTVQGRNYLSFTGSTKLVMRPPSVELEESNPVPNLYGGLVKQLGEASVLIDDAFNIEHVYGEATPYLSFANGKPALNLADMIHQAFRQEIRALAFKALREEKQIYGQPKKIKIDGKVVSSRVSVIPLNKAEEDERFLLIVFERVASVKRSSSENGGSGSERIKELESELAAAREHLQTVIEELETSNEELQSLNEELQSSNEELQSSNEELETTNEELQSANEELVTMNDELNSKTVALEQTTTQLINIKNSLDYPLLVIDENYNILRSNLVARHVYELRDGIFNLAAVVRSADEREQLKMCIRETQDSGEPRQFSFQDHGKYIWVHIMPFRQRDNSVSGTVLSFIDNTQMVRQTMELEESRKRAHSASIAKTEFLANVSHEIRTPLNAIYGVVEILKLKLSEETKKETHLQVLENSAVSLKELLNDLLDFARLESGKIKLEYVSFSIRALIDKIHDNYSMLAERKLLELNFELPDSFQDVYIGDPLRVQQIIVNLLSNAIKFTDSGRVSIQISTGPGGTPLIIAIEDTGIGIKASELETIFEKFSQSDASISRRYGGTGLGLAIVRELVKAMDGDIRVESVLGQGSTFTVSLPLKVGNFSEQVAEIQRQPLILFDNIDEAKKHRILVVDDHHSNVVVMASFLDQLACVYDVVESGHEAIRHVSDTEYACILLDLHMEGLDGFSTYQQIRDIEQQKGRQAAAVIAVSGNVQQSVIDKTKEIGVRRFLQKPLELSNLRGALSEILLER